MWRSSKLSVIIHSVTIMTDTDHQILALAGRHYRQEGARERAARDELGLTPTLFWAHVNRLVDDPAAMLEEPQLTARLRRIREQRRGLRAAG